LVGGSTFELGGGGGWLHFAGLQDRPRALGRLALRVPLGASFVSTFAATQLLSADLEGARVLQSDLRFDLERAFGQRTAVGVAIFGTRFDDASLGSVDRFGGAEARVRHQLTRSTQIVLRYRYWTNGGPYRADDFHQNRATLELRFAPPIL